MKPARWCGYLINAALLALSCFALDRPLSAPSINPGVYNTPCLVSFTREPGIRLSLFLDGTPLSPDSTSVYLEGTEGEEITYTVQAVFTPIEPGLPVLSVSEYVWTIDRKKPARPVLKAVPAEEGWQVSLSLSGEGMLSWCLYHRFTGTLARDTVLPGSSVYVPNGAVLCAFAIDSAGNRGPSASYAAPVRNEAGSPFRVLNPVPGMWANTQTLLIESMPGTVVLWSLDGSDPLLSGQVYEGPVLLDSGGVTTLRLCARDASGTLWSEQVLYSVVESPVPSLGAYTAGQPVLETGDFYELPIPEGLRYSFGDTLPVLPGGKNILFSAVRGMLRYFPLTLSDGIDSWRIICSSGRSHSTSEKTVSRSSSSTDDPSISIHGWHFIAIDYRFPVFYSLDDGSWNEYTGPVFSDRNRNSVLDWYSPAWKSGEVQRINLPAIPAVTGIPEKGMTGGPVFLSIPDSPFAYTYTVGTLYAPESPSAASAELASGLLFEVPSGSASRFQVRYLAALDGIVHGELSADFLIDRKTPRIPSPGIDPQLVWSRSPVRFSPSGEDTLHVEITPDLYARDGASYILSGAPGKKIDYRISVYACDEVGNRSETVTRSITVDLNAIYVDASAAVPGDGSPSRPFASLDDALDIVRGRSLWRLYLQGRSEIKKQHTILSDLELSGSDAELDIAPEAGFVVSGSTMTIRSCTVRQSFSGPDTSRNQLPVVAAARPLFDLQNAVFSAIDCNVSSAGRQSYSLVRASGSAVSFSGCFISAQAVEYVAAVDAKRSQVSIINSDFSCSAHDASVLSLFSSSIVMNNSRFSVSVGLSGRILEAWESSAILDTIVFDRSGVSVDNRDSALFLDAKSFIVSEKSVVNNGFWKRETRGSR